MSKYTAPAKVNLHLAITDVNNDGYHGLDTSFVFVDVGDTLDISLADELTLSCSDTSLNGKKNLVYQVLSAFAIKHNIDQGLHIEINKKLPSQAGLGGGSSDAATALMVANKLWQVGCSQDELIAFAVPFGADIPCFIYGEVSLAKGIGEQLSPFPHHIPTETIVLAWPGMGVSTAAAFAHFDENYFHALTDESSAAKVRARSDDESFVLGYNDLEQSAIILCSPLEDMLSAMRKQSVRAWMSGSGSACVALCHSFTEAQSLVDDLTSKALASWVHIGHFMPEHPLKEKIGA
ncbi:MAG TPA: 4-(cytidine 5'-diphospho)-2-C-methyl-D-erythritol kinase [Ghiorsea sp.]|nr:4-(cytidine 5'-diphospho)-2-C-methyl-D-erythritol kinase [Ghiorsea sp.]HIP07676.1 4-(cytidine 5'-diphospho)-2-C-methyl-D-erythritol kinase [Mariprofundaceae bacterium]